MIDIICPIEMFNMEQTIFIDKESVIVPNEAIVNFLFTYCTEHLVNRIVFIGKKDYIIGMYATELAEMIKDVKIEVLEG